MKNVTKKIFLLFTLSLLTMLFAGLLTASAASYETWVIKNATNMRTGSTTGSGYIATIPEKTKIKVTSKKTDGTYVWGKISYKGYTGWCVLNYSEYKSGSLSTPEITTTSKLFVDTAALKWKSVPTATKYTLTIYNADGKKYKSVTTSDTSYEITLPASGYKAMVTAKNSRISSWSAKSGYYAFTVTSSTITSIKITGATSVVKGSTAALKVSVLPSQAKDKSVKWSSSDEKILTVSSSGTVKGVSYGVAYAVCKANKGNASTKYKISVVPKKCAAPVYKSSTDSSVTFSWDKISGVKGYKIYIYNTSTKKYTLIDTVSEASYTLSKQKAGSDVTVSIRAYAVSGSTTLTGDYSDKMVFPIQAAAPSGLSVTGSTNKSVSLKWSKTTGASKYAVYKYNTKTSSYKKVKTTTATAYTLSAAAGEQVKVKVRAIRTINSKDYYGNYSNALVLFACPDTPTVTAAKAGSKFNLSWTKIENASCYNIQYCKETDMDYKTFTYTHSAVRLCEINDLPEGTYYFKVRAYVTDGSTTCFGEWSEPVKITV